MPVVKPCGANECAVNCTAECGWSRLLGKCVIGLSTDQSEIDERLGDCDTPDKANSDRDDDSGSSLGTIIGAAVAILLIACLIGVLVVMKRRSADKRPGNADDPNATTVDNAVFVFPGNDGAASDNIPAPDYHVPDFGDGKNTTNHNATSEPDYDEVQAVLGTQASGASAEPDYQGALVIGNQVLDDTADPNYADASGLIPKAGSGGCGDYDDVNFEGAALLNGLPPNAVSNAPMYDKQPANDAPRPASLYDVMVDDGVGAAPRSVQMIRGNAAQVPSERSNGASEVFGDDATAIYEQAPAGSATRSTTGEWQVGGGYESIENNSASIDYETQQGGNLSHDYEALEDRGTGPTAYEVMQGGGSGDALYGTTESNGNVTFRTKQGAKQGAPGNVV